MEKIENEVVTMENLRNIMGDLGVRKAMGSDGVSNWMLRESKEKLAEKVVAMIEWKVPTV